MSNLAAPSSIKSFKPSNLYVSGKSQRGNYVSRMDLAVQYSSPRSKEDAFQYMIKSVEELNKVINNSSTIKSKNSIQRRSIDLNVKLNS